ncbi:30S ribosomal subunit protein S19 [Candidatus Xenohaliotis californiensis]|uniref:Small ribosomal subunit protein uS19 n=1 Tax=Candidatus Xenohaliotis californiensis TaxID=84677 RepID=A0ABM9N8K9_9RICK|nr:30S ribosomal subunit protein S19 [Candidatus Xenohaliotis californiensis]
MARRSVWKGPYVDHSLIKIIKSHIANNKGTKMIKTDSRRSTIIPAFVGYVFGVHNGKKYIPVSVSEDMVGCKFGEFSPTRTYYGHAVDKKKGR